MQGPVFAAIACMENKCRITIVNHSPDNLEMIKTVLESQSFVVQDLAPDAGNFEIIGQFAPDLIILDFVPGDPENWRLLEQIRCNENTKSIPVICLSTLEALAQQCQVLYGIEQVLTKPFDLNGLLKAISDLIQP